eukprot:10675771-Alexandrium_andersonii.AAC.1
MFTLHMFSSCRRAPGALLPRHFKLHLFAPPLAPALSRSALAAHLVPAIPHTTPARPCPGAPPMLLA